MILKTVFQTCVTYKYLKKKLHFIAIVTEFLKPPYPPNHLSPEL